AGRRLPAPRLNSLGLAVWRRLVLRALNLLDNPGRPFHRRDVQLLASLPLLGEGRELPAPDQWLLWMAQQPGWMQPAEDGEGELLSDRLQLAYPWLRTDASADAQGGVEAPEGSLAGLLARSALERGSYRSAARQRIYRYQDSEPPLAWTQALQHRQWTPLGELSLAQRVCLLGPSPRGPQLLSDVSCAADPRTRQAAVRRLINVVIQAARQAGEELVFEANGEALWARVRERLSDLMRALLSAGALSSDGQAFAVRCGRDTMRQSDIDAGRLLAEIEIQPAQPIQRIVVVLNLRDAGPARLLAEAA
ncbi:phage tail sheath C-terminal domain-containing protein, partial [Paucibacter sp. XJ19-41]|uniref:phage tail sheath C-terminal domain-containing protein n=1 Tax=Paucibacter sp. XJ19-41 TaxID=2927824 RepID=UPI002349112E